MLLVGGYDSIVLMRILLVLLAGSAFENSAPVQPKQLPGPYSLIEQKQGEFCFLTGYALYNQPRQIVIRCENTESACNDTRRLVAVLGTGFGVIGTTGCAECTNNPKCYSK